MGETPSSGIFHSSIPIESLIMPSFLIRKELNIRLSIPLAMRIVGGIIDLIYKVGFLDVRCVLSMLGGFDL